MTHFGQTTLSRTTPTEWLQVGASVGQLVNDWSGRHDLIAYVGGEAAVDRGAPALFTPSSGEVEVNTNIAFPGVTPDQIGDLTHRSTQFEFPKGVGAILHEALHARYSTFDIGQAQRDLTPNQYKGMYLMEEGRIEALGVRTMPQNKSFLTAMAMGISLGDLNDIPASALSSVRSLAQLIAITYGRVTAGVLSNEDIEPFARILPMIAPEGLLTELRPLWTEYQILVPELHLERMYELARKWEEVVAKYAEEAGEDDGEGEGESGSEGEIGEVARALREALQEIAENAEFSATGEAMEQQASEERAEALERSQSSSKERRENKKVSDSVFSHSSGPGGVRKTSSRLIDTRNPTSPERASAVRIAQALERAKYRDRVRTEAESVTPPGRLRTRAVVQGRAMRARGVMDTTAPWNRVQRKHVDDPNLTIGVMVDISGSMRSAMEPLASAAWVLSEATRRVQGRTAMVYYGDDVFPTLKPGQHLDKVTVYSASDSTEEFGKAFQALDGALDLLNGSGARLLVVVSDGHYRSDQRSEVARVMKRCERDGVAVLWVGVGHYGADAERYCTTASSSYTKMGDTITEVADEIGRQAERALTVAGSRV